MVEREGLGVNGAAAEKQELTGFLFTRNRWKVPGFLHERNGESAHEVLQLSEWSLLVLLHPDSNTPLSWYDARRVAMVCMREGAWDNLEPEHLECRPFSGTDLPTQVVAWVRWSGRDGATDPQGKRMEYLVSASSTKWRRL